MRAVADTRGEMQAKRPHQIKEGFIIVVIVMMNLDMMQDAYLRIVAICQSDNLRHHAHEI